MTRNGFQMGQREVLEAIGRGASLDDILDKIVRLIEARKKGLLCSILLLDRERQRVRHGAAPSLPKAYIASIDGSRIGPNEGACGAAAYRGERIISRNIATDPNWEGYRLLALANGLRSCWSSPIFSPSREVLGTFAIYYPRPHVPSKRETQWVDVATHLAAIAILRARSEIEIRQSAQALRKSEAEEKLRAAAYEHVLDLICYFSVEQNERFRLLSANPAANRMTGIDTTGAIGKYLEDILPVGEQDGIERYRRAVREHRTIKWDQKFSRFPSGEKYAEVAITPVEDSSGRCTNIVVTAHDLTERKKAEEQIAAQAALLDGTCEAILMRGFDGIIHYWNEGATRLYGWTRAEVLGRNIKELIYHDPLAFERAQSTLLEKETWSGELVHYTKDGSKLAVEGSWTLKRDEQGRPKYVLAIDSDVTEKRNLQMQIILAQRMESLGTLAGGIAHDFNNILTAILGNVSLLLNGSQLEAKARDKLEVVQAAGRRAADLVGQILAFSRHHETKRTLSSLSPSITEAAKLLRATLPAMIDVRLECGPEELEIEADPSQIHQIVMNLGTNSAHAIGDRIGKIEIALAPVQLLEKLAGIASEIPPGRYLRIRVTDDGAGMEEATLRRIFDPFFTTKPPGKGTGLGLSVVHGIVKRHGGAITVESSLGKGTTFEVYLPARAEGAAPSQPAELLLLQPDFRRKTEILYVDDEECIVVLLTQRLENLGFRVQGFTDPRKAIEAFTANPHRFSAVVSDFYMARMSGLDFAREILKRDPKVPVVMVSGYLGDVDKEGLRRAGVRALLPKPAFIDELAPLLSRLLSTPSAA